MPLSNIEHSLTPDLKSDCRENQQNFISRESNHQDILSFEPLPTGQFIARLEDGTKIARTFTKQEVEQLREWKPPELPPACSHAMKVANGRALLKAIDIFLNWKFDDCPSCGSPELIENLCEPSSPHYAELRCGRCDRWIRWLPCPNTAVKKEKLRRRVNRLLEKAQGWNRRFLESIADRGKASPKQLEIIDRIEKNQGRGNEN